MSGDHFRVSIFTDTHLGYKEKSDIYGKESFDVFEEALTKSEEYGADIILHGGDLFENTNPSISTLVYTMKITKNHLLGEGNSVEVISSDGLTSNPNCYDDNIRVKIPMFIIYGNHDKPGGFNFVTVDELLSVPGLINLFNSSDSKEGIELQPVVLKKGSIRLVLYGLCNIHDSKFVSILQKHKLRLQQVQEPDSSITRTFTILMIHQSRSDYDKTKYDLDKLLLENLSIDDNPENSEKIVDLIIWGHEHDNCITDFQLTKDNIIMQPGSTICTQLKKSMATKRSMAILDISETNQTIEPITLERARPLIHDSIDLNDITKHEGCDSDEIIKYIKGHINGLIEQFHNELIESESITLLPYVRITIKSTANDKILHQLKELSSDYAGKVANPDQSMFKFKEHKSTKKENDTEEYIKNDDYDIEDMIKIYSEKDPYKFFSEEVLNTFLKDSIESTSKDHFSKRIEEYMNKSIELIQKESLAKSEGGEEIRPLTRIESQKFVRDFPKIEIQQQASASSKEFSYSIKEEQKEKECQPLNDSKPSKRKKSKR